MEKHNSKKRVNDSGRKGRLDEQTLGYYRRVSETVKEGFENQDVKDVFLKNIFKQLSEELVKVSQNQTASGILEDLLDVAGPEQMVLLVEPVSRDFEVMCSDKFASHVLQSFMMQTGHYIHRTTSQKEDVQQLQECMQNLWEFFKTSMGLYMQHTYASHVLRVMIEVMGGVKVTDSIIRSRVSKHFKKGGSQEAKAFDESVEPSEEQLQELKKLYKDIIGFSKLSDYLENSMSNPVIQTVLLVLQKRLPKSCDKMCKKLLRYCFEETEDGKSVGGLVTGSCGSHLVEQIVGLVSPELFEEVFEKYIKEKITSLAFHPVANFVLQKVINMCHTKHQFEIIFVDLCDVIEDLMARNHLGVVVQLAEGCVRHGTKQEKFVKCLMKSFHCYKPAQRQCRLATLTASLTTYEVFYKKSKENSSEESSESENDEGAQSVPVLKSVNYHGSLLLQKMLQFGNPKIIVASLLDLQVVDLVTMSCDPCGSHVIEVFITSDTVGERNRGNFVNKLKDGYERLACSKNGSRTLDSIWSKATVNQKMSIAEELVEHSAKLKSDRFGHHIWRNFGLQLFTTKKDLWEDFQLGKVRKRKMFEDIVSSHGKKRVKVKDSILKVNHESKGDIKEVNIKHQDAQNDSELKLKKKRKPKETSPKHLVKQTLKKRKRPKTTNSKKRLLKS